MGSSFNGPAGAPLHIGKQHSNNSQLMMPHHENSGFFNQQPRNRINTDTQSQRSGRGGIRNPQMMASNLYQDDKGKRKESPRAAFLQDRPGFRGSNQRSPQRLINNGQQQRQS